MRENNLNLTNIFFCPNHGDSLEMKIKHNIIDSMRLSAPPQHPEKRIEFRSAEKNRIVHGPTQCN